MAVMIPAVANGGRNRKMGYWMSRFDPRNWVVVSRSQAEANPLFGLRGRFLVVLAGMFALSLLTLVVEFTLYSDDPLYQRAAHNNVIIFAISFAIGVGVFLRAWWTRYLAYLMFAVTLSNLLLFADVQVQGRQGEAAATFFWMMLGLFLLRDLPLCLYLTASRRARLTLEHQVFRHEPPKIAAQAG